MRILIPKARAEQGRWQSALADSGLQPVFADPWQIEQIPETPEQRTCWLNLDEFSGVICVSPSAAQALIDALDQYWPMPPAEVYWLCNGPRTARTLQSGHLTACFPDSGYTAEDVLALPQTKVNAGDKWLIVKGEGGRVTYPEVLAERGALVTTVEVYRRSMNESGLRELQQQALNAEALWLSSQFLGEQLLQRNSDFWRQWRGQWWVSSQRIGDWLQQQGCLDIHISDGATPDALAALATTAAGR